MREERQIERDIALTFDFLRHLIEHPEMIDDIPDGAEIQFVAPDIVTTEPAEDRPHERKRVIIEAKRTYDLFQETDRYRER